MGPTWGPPGSCRPQMGPMLAPWTLLSAEFYTGVISLLAPPKISFCHREPWARCIVAKLLGVWVLGHRDAQSAKVVVDCRDSICGSLAIQATKDSQEVASAAGGVIGHVVSGGFAVQAQQVSGTSTAWRWGLQWYTNIGISARLVNSLEVIIQGTNTPSIWKSE